MSERYKLQEHIQQHIKTNAGAIISEYSISVAQHVMKALDSWIEEQGVDTSELNVGDTVKLKRELRSGDDTKTYEICDVSEEMEGIAVNDLGEVKEIGKHVAAFDDDTYLVKFDATTVDWWFHVDDLEKV